MSRGFALVAILLVAGCGHSIGDSCQTNVDCSPLGDRFCDIATPGGYCTIEDCGPTTGPSEAACIRFFVPILNEPCTLGIDGQGKPTALPQANCRHPDEICVCTRVLNGKCQNNNAGTCAPSSTEKHWCQKLCNNNGDCRQGYECRETGTLGASPLPSFDFGANQTLKFCAPIEPGNPPIPTI
jgi:hypothetical protein